MDTSTQTYHWPFDAGAICSITFLEAFNLASSENSGAAFVAACAGMVGAFGSLSLLIEDLDVRPAAGMLAGGALVLSAHNFFGAPIEFPTLKVSNTPQEQPLQQGQIPKAPALEDVGAYIPS